MMMKWIPGYEDRYEISSDGKIVISHVRGKPKELKQKLGRDGYWRTPIAQEWMLTHRLVLAAYSGKCPPGMIARHLDGDCTNNDMTNLAWGTHSENMKDKRQHGTDHNANKTHCPLGHAYDQENTYYRPDRPGNRGCRACNRMAHRKRKAVK